MLTSAAAWMTRVDAADGLTHRPVIANVALDASDRGHPRVPARRANTIG